MRPISASPAPATASGGKVAAGRPVAKRRRDGGRLSFPPRAGRGAAKRSRLQVHRFFPPTNRATLRERLVSEVVGLPVTRGRDHLGPEVLAAKNQLTAGDAKIWKMRLNGVWTALPPLR